MEFVEDPAAAHVQIIHFLGAGEERLAQQAGSRYVLVQVRSRSAAAICICIYTLCRNDGVNHGGNKCRK